MRVRVWKREARTIRFSKDALRNEGLVPEVRGPQQPVDYSLSY